MTSSILNSLAFVALGFSISCGNKAKTFEGSAPVSYSKSAEAAPIVAPAPEPLPPAPPAVLPPPALPPNAIVKGSFTLFTTPPDPGPDEDYTIHVKVTLPKQAAVYPSSDLFVHVLGTDGYEVLFSAGKASVIETVSPTFRAPGVVVVPHPLDASKKAVVREEAFAFSANTTPTQTEGNFSILIPGGAVEVKDSIEVKSVQLNEAQKAILEF